MRCQTGASSTPPAARVSITKEPESAEVTKKMATRIIAKVEVTLDQGRYSRNSNRATDAFAAASWASWPAATPISRKMAVLPKTVIQKKVKTVGTSKTPSTNSRTVRPREMRAMNMPTKGDHAIHQAQ